jgi:hypothetical protein
MQVSDFKSLLSKDLKKFIWFPEKEISFSGNH